MKAWIYLNTLCIALAVGASVAQATPAVKENCERMLARGAEILADSAGNTELHRAILRADRDLIGRLVHERADLNVRNKEQRTPLDLALLSEKKGVLLAFLHAVLDLPEEEDEIARGSAHWDLFFELPQAELTKTYGGSLLAYLVVKWRKDSPTRKYELREILDYLQMRSRGDFIYQTGRTGVSGLYYAVFYNDHEAIDLLMRENGLDPNFVGEVEDENIPPPASPLQLAATLLKKAEDRYLDARLSKNPAMLLLKAEEVVEARKTWHMITADQDEHKPRQNVHHLYQ